MPRDEIQLEEFFISEFMDKALKIYGLTKRKEYPNLSLEIEKYKNRLKTPPGLSGIFNFGDVNDNIKVYHLSTFWQRISLPPNIKIL